MVGRTGFEPVKAEPADLQSAPFGHFGTYPFFPLWGMTDLPRSQTARKSNFEKDRGHIGERAFLGFGSALVH